MQRQAWEANKILDTLCLVCGKENRFHKVFWSPWVEGYVRQQIDVIEPDGTSKLVPSADHHACLTNLDYLEYMDEKKSR